MNAIIVLVLCVAALGTVVCQQIPCPFVVEGKEALPGDVPWMVSLSSDESNGKHFCGGSILDSTHILTSYDCVEGLNLKNALLRARIGSLDLDNGGVQYDVVNMAKMDNLGIVILCTNKEMVLDSTLPVPTGKVALPTSNTDLAQGTMVRVAGWGVNTYNNTGCNMYGRSGVKTFSDRLQVVDILIVEPAYCWMVYALTDISDGIICAGAEGLGSCVGDAGSPLTLDGVQYAVASAGSFPCDYFPGLFYKVNPFIDEIYTNLEKKCEKM